MVMAAPVGRARRANATMICGKPAPRLAISEQLMAHLIKLRDKYGAINIESGRIKLIVRLWNNNDIEKFIIIPHFPTITWVVNASKIIALSELDAYIAEHASEILGRHMLTITHYNIMRYQDDEEDDSLMHSDVWDGIRTDDGILTLSSGQRLFYDEFGDVRRTESL
jgi:hypothetical protein